MRDEMVNAYLDSYDTITVEMNKNFFCLQEKFFHLQKKEKIVELPIKNVYQKDDLFIYHLSVPTDIEISQKYEVVTINNYTVPLIYRFIVKTEKFNQQFYYGEDDLGVTIKNGITTFKVWAPTAYKIWLMCNDKMYKMIRGKCGVFSLSFDGDLSNVEYTYLVDVNNQMVETIDPYGKCQSANSEKSVVINTSEKSLKIREETKEKVIYELSVADFSEEGTFKSMKENIDYLADLGVNYVQIMPVNDFAGVNDYHPKMYYNWGYNPISYQTLKQAYSSNINKSDQVVTDFKDLVNTLHDKGIKVVLDVVFNHHYNASESSFEKLVPYYYFRFENGKYSVKGGCGAEFDSKQLMCRKYFADTLNYYTEFYDIDGFRFDLMGFLDVKTMNYISETLKNVRQDILLYGEGWMMDSAEKDEPLATSQNRELLKDYGFFNDGFRDCLKGNTFDKSNKGYLTGNSDLAVYAGNYFGKYDKQSINFVQCHDNMTCYDKIVSCLADKNEKEWVQRQKLLIAAVLFSSGISFLSMGQEYCISKNFRDNCYNANDGVNKFKVPESELYQGVINYTKQLISLKKSIGLNEDGRVHQFSGILLVKNQKYEYIFNPKEERCIYHFVGNREVVFDGENKSDNLVSNQYEIAPLSFVILKE